MWLCRISINFHKTLELIPIMPTIAKCSFLGLVCRIGDITGGYLTIILTSVQRSGLDSNSVPVLSTPSIMQIVTVTIRYLLSPFCSTSTLTNQTVFTGSVLHRILS